MHLISAFSAIAEKGVISPNAYAVLDYFFFLVLEANYLGCALGIYMFPYGLRGKDLSTTSCESC